MFVLVSLKIQNKKIVHSYCPHKVYLLRNKISRTCNNSNNNDEIKYGFPP